MSKFCKDCKHFSSYSLDGFIHTFCTRQTGEIDLVHGKPVTNTYSPDAERKRGVCGKEGKLFEKKPPFLMRFFKS